MKKQNKIKKKEKLKLIKYLLKYENISIIKENKLIT